MSNRGPSAVAFLLMLGACHVNLEVPARSQVACATDADCPSGRRCVTALGQCVAPGVTCTTEGVGGQLVLAKDGNACNLEDTGGTGICVTGHCQAPRCGDGVVTPPEQCDDGTANSEAPNAACRTDCTPRRCGDGIVDLGEECDDGNTSNNDACLNDCHTNVCGDGFVNVGVEQCDDGNNNPFDACNACQLNYCGDGLLNLDPTSPGYENCEDLNSNPNDGCDQCRKTAWVPTVLVGEGEPQGDPLREAFTSPSLLAVDRHDNMYVYATAVPQIFRIDHATGRVTLLAGTGLLTQDGDGGPARAASLGNVVSMTTDRYGNLIIADWSNANPPTVSAIRRVDVNTGIITTVVGGGATAGLLDGVAASAASLYAGTMAAIDDKDEIIFASADGTLYRVDPTTMLIHLIGGGGVAAAADGLLATAAVLNVNALTVDAQGRPIMLLGNFDPSTGAELTSPSVYRLEVPAGASPIGATLTWLAGGGPVIDTSNPSYGLLPYGDGGPARGASLGSYEASARVDDAGTIFLAEPDRGRVRWVTFSSASDPSSGTIDTFAGNGLQQYGGDGGPARSASLGPADVSFDGTGEVFVADSFSERVRVVSPGGVISTFAGNGNAFLLGEGGSAVSQPLSTVYSLMVESASSWLVAQPALGRIRRVSCANPDAPWTCVVQTVADFTSGPLFPFSAPLMFVSLQGGVEWATSGHGIIQQQRVNPADSSTWIYTPIAGSATVSGPASDGPLSQARFNTPVGIVADSQGHVYVYDSLNYAVRRIDRPDLSDPTTWTIATVAGTGVDCGTAGSCPAANAAGSTGPARSQALNPASTGRALAIDSQDRLLIGDYNRVWRVTFSSLADPTSGTIEAYAGVGRSCSILRTGVQCGDADGALQPFVSGTHAGACFGSIYSLMPLADGRLLVGDTSNRIRVLTPGAGSNPAPSAGTLATFVGNGGRVDTGDGGPAQAAQFREPWSLAAGTNGDLILGLRRALRRVAYTTADDPTTAVMRSMAGDVLVGDGPELYATLGFPSGLADISAAGDGSLVAFTDGIGGRARVFDLNAARVDTLLGYPGTPFDIGTSPSDARWVASRVDLAAEVFDPVARVLYVADAGLHTIELLDLSGSTPQVSRLAGTTGVAGYADGPLAASLFSRPAGLAWHAADRVLYVADSGNHVVRAIAVATGMVTTIAGTAGRAGFFGEGDPPDSCLFSGPAGLAVGANATRPDGSLFISDTGNARVRRLDLDQNEVTTVIGTGAAGSAGDGSPAYAFSVDSPNGLSFDGYGNLIVASRTAVRLVTAVDGVADGQGSVLTVYGAPPRVSFPASVTNCISAVRFLPGDAAILVADSCAGLILRLDRVKP